MLQILDFGRSDRYCHLRSVSYIIITRKYKGVLLASAFLSARGTFMNEKNTGIEFELFTILRAQINLF